MTEADARITQCCGPEGCGYFNDQPRPARWCVGSECAAWRWFETHVRNDQLPVPIPNVDGGELVRSTRTHGCCGLAGHWFGQMRGFDRARGSDVQ